MHGLRPRQRTRTGKLRLPLLRPVPAPQIRFRDFGAI